MKTSIVVLSSFVLATSAAVADTSLLEAVGKQAVQNSANAVAPDAVKGAEAAGAAVDSAQAVKAGAENAPTAAKQQVEEAAKQAVKAGKAKAKQKAAEKALDLLQ